MSTPPELSFSRRVGAVNCTPDHLQCPRITMPSYIALAIPWDSASVDVMAWNFWPLDLTDMGPFFHEKIIPVVLRDRVVLSCTCHDESTEMHSSSLLSATSKLLSSTLERDHFVWHSE